MEEIRGAALAYYNNFSEEQKQQVLAAFREIDTDGNCTVSFRELQQIMDDSTVGPNELFIRQYRLFAALDANGDGKLGFEEFITFFYIVISKRYVWCDGCKAFLKGLYFTCVDCFQSNSFDLCTSCYHNHNHSHPHSNFLDNYALLRSGTEIVSNQLQESSSVSVESRELVVSRSGRKRDKLLQAIVHFNTGYSLGNAVYTIGTNLCSIM